ncbi:MAG: hydroxyisourate hydrolase, partial [Rubrivivax sp.]|nr:hydroxyisourate hydrolase [Rubrivivax sp.]
MGHLSTHVLDTAHGCPAAGMAVTLQRLDGDAAVTLQSLLLNADGRADGPLLDAAAM